MFVTRTVESTAVVIVGAGPAGLALANMLRRAAIDCVVLERRSRAYAEQRQRAGVLENRGLRTLEKCGVLDDVLSTAPPANVMEVRVDGVARHLALGELTGGRPARMCLQQVLVRTLLECHLAAGGDVRFEAGNVALHDVTGERPVVTYSDPAGGEHEIECRFIGGCDGEHGISRVSAPDGAWTVHAEDQGVSHLCVVANAPPPRCPVFAVSPDGFAAQFPRGPAATRFYLQFGPDDDPTSWPDEELWRQLRLRLHDEERPGGPVTERTVVRMRSRVHDPMSCGRLYLVGDAAHILPHLGGKGMSLALNDAAVLAQGLRALIRAGDDAPLRAYSETCLRRVWECQALATWMCEVLHDAGNGRTGSFRHGIARASLERLFSSPAAATAFAEQMAGAGR